MRCRQWGTLTSGIEAGVMAGVMLYSVGCFGRILSTSGQDVRLLMSGISAEKGLSQLFERLRNVQSGVRPAPLRPARGVPFAHRLAPLNKPNATLHCAASLPPRFAPFCEPRVMIRRLVCGVCVVNARRAGHGGRRGVSRACGSAYSLCACPEISMPSNRLAPQECRGERNDSVGKT